jgi:anti-sigma factor RsiW
MSCAERLTTQAFIDGELLGAAAEAIETHIAACAECQAFCADAAALSDAIRAEVPRLAAPPDLRARVRRLLDQEGASAAGSRRPPLRGQPTGFWRGAFSGAGLTALAAGMAGLLLSPPAPATLVEQVTTAHTTALMRGREIEVASTDHHTVRPWFAGRAPLSPPVADFAAQGFPLVGGRLGKIAGAPAAVVVYQHGKHRIDLFVWADRGGDLPSEGLSRGYHSRYWKSHDLDFAAVSDTSAPELERFVSLVRSEPE